jgi:hypothetical protein
MNIMSELYYRFDLELIRRIHVCVYLHVKFADFCQIKFKSNSVEPTVHCADAQPFGILHLLC